jgi:hypothetical protein
VLQGDNIQYGLTTRRYAQGVPQKANALECSRSYGALMCTAAIIGRHRSGLTLTNAISRSTWAGLWPRETSIAVEADAFFKLGEHQFLAMFERKGMKPDQEHTGTLSIMVIFAIAFCLFTII